MLVEVLNNYVEYFFVEHIVGAFHLSVPDGVLVDESFYLAGGVGVAVLHATEEVYRQHCIVGLHGVVDAEGMGVMVARVMAMMRAVVATDRDRYFTLVVIYFIRSNTGGDAVRFVEVEEDGTVGAARVDGHLLVAYEALLGSDPRVALQYAEDFVFGEREVLGGGHYLQADGARVVAVVKKHHGSLQIVLVIC